MGSWESLDSSASSSLRAQSLETPDSSRPESEDHLEEKWTDLGLKTKHNTEERLVDSGASLPTGRDAIEYEVRVNQRNIERICLCCGSLNVYTQHPMFEGGMCAPCKDKFLESLFVYDDDGCQRYCSICGWGDTLFICESPDCTRCYCFECVDSLLGPGTSELIQGMSCWVCFLCLPFPRSGLLQRRKKWRCRLKVFHDFELCLRATRNHELIKPLEIQETVPVCKREAVLVRVLTLFWDIKKDLKGLGILESGSNSEGGKLKFLDDVTCVVRKDVEKWGPFDLLFGSTKPPGSSHDHCPGWYLFQFYRILQYAQPSPSSQQPFFWMFLDNLLMNEDDQSTTTRFLETEPVILQDTRGRVLQKAVRVWTNIPAVKSKHVALTPEEELSLRFQVNARAKLAAQGLAPVVKNCFLPLREYFKYFPENSLPL